MSTHHGWDPRDDHIYRVPKLRKPGERTALTINIVATDSFRRNVSLLHDRIVNCSTGQALMRSFFDSQRPSVTVDVAKDPTDYDFVDDEIFPPGCDRGATVRRLASVLPKLFWARRLEVAQRECHNMFRSTAMWEHDDARALLRIARRHCDAENVAADASLIQLLELRVQFYDRADAACPKSCMPWWKPVVDAHKLFNDVLLSNAQDDQDYYNEHPYKKFLYPFDRVNINALVSRLPQPCAIDVVNWIWEECALHYPSRHAAAPAKTQPSHWSNIAVAGT